MANNLRGSTDTEAAPRPDAAEAVRLEPVAAASSQENLAASGSPHAKPRKKKKKKVKSEIKPLKLLLDSACFHN